MSEEDNIFKKIKAGKFDEVNPDSYAGLALESVALDRPTREKETDLPPPKKINWKKKYNDLQKELNKLKTEFVLVEQENLQLSERTSNMDNKTLAEFMTVINSLHVNYNKSQMAQLDELVGSHSVIAVRKWIVERIT